MLALTCAFLAVVTRLFYWQIVKGETLKAEAKEQYQRMVQFRGSRGAIYTQDGALLAGLSPVYRLFAEPHRLELPPSTLAQTLHPFLLELYGPYQTASSSTEQQLASLKLASELQQKLEKPGAKWVSLMTGLSPEQKERLAALNLKGLGFEPGEKRSYPEASMAAHLLGFVGKNETGDDLGYFGVEGALDKELRGRTYQEIMYSDAPLAGAGLAQLAAQKRVQGRDITLTIRRDVQHLLETELQQALTTYSAKAGEVIVMEPSTGKILGAASYPSYDPVRYSRYQTELYKNPIVSAFYEPGSIFKPLTVAAGIDAGVISPDTPCPRCDGPVQRDNYSIKTWNNQYTPGITIKEALAKSDNTAMIYIADQLGRDRFKTYIQNFGIGEQTNIDLQEDPRTLFPTKWDSVELATRSFGQGISATSLQMIRAIAVIANGGNLMKPQIVEKVTDPATGKELPVPPVVERRVISADAARQVTQMMEYAATKGEAQWTSSKSHRVAGKTGTSQIALGGEYDEENTIATFVAFAPPDNPQFIMLVKLVEPQSSIWAAETAAPLWYRIADRLYLLLNIPPDRAELV